ncbi:DUF6603 domain-containing protein [Streptomyces sp. NPDC005279]|uniref:DUF6603 domain-containing protein n=1 Tax=Streptomyces sp. NPDC005279 TaxID=3364712 RepID=UPI00369EEE9E
MTEIDDIIATVEGLSVAQDGSLTLAAADFTGIDVVGAFFTSVIGAQSYTLAAATRTPGSGTITVTGTADVLGYAGVGAAVTFTTATGQDGSGPAPPVGTGVTASVTGTLVSETPMPLPIVSWVDVVDVSVSATVAEQYNAVTYGFAASIVLSGETAGSIPITISQRDGGLWTVQVAGEAGQSVTADQLVALLGGQTLEQFLPSELVSILDGLAISDLSITFDATAETVTEVSVGLTVTNGWTLTSGLVLDPGLHIALTLQNPTDDTTRDATAAVTGTVEIDTTKVPVFVQVDVAAGGTSSWFVGLDPATSGVTLPSLSGLFTLAGGSGFASSLPGVLANLPGVQIDPLLIGFTLDPAALQSASFGATTTSTWPIIEGFLEVDQLAFDLTLAGLDGDTKSVGGSLTAVFEIASDVGLYFECQKDPATSTWTFSGGLPPGRPLNLTDLVSKLLKPFVTIPAGAPALVLDTADLTVVPSTSMTLTAGSTTKWQLLTELSLDTFTLTFSYTDGAPQPFTGELTTTMTVATVPLLITAGLDTSGAWSFSGATGPGTQISGGDLADDLASSFGVTAVPHDALTGLTISDIDIAFSSGTASKPSAFHFGCDGTFLIVGVELDITVAIDLTGAATGYTGSFVGKLTIKKENATTEEVDVTFLGGKLTADWTSTIGHGLSLTDLASCFGFGDLPPIPAAVDLTLKTMKFVYDVPSAALSIAATTKSGDTALFVTANVPSGGTTPRRFAFAVDLPLNVTLADLPVVGDLLPDAGQYGIPEFGCWIVSGDLAGTGTASDAAALNALIPTGYPTLPPAPLTAGVLLFGKLLLGSETMPLELALSGASSAPAALPAPAEAATAAPARVDSAAAAASDSSTVKWFTVQRSYGGFTLARVGVQYDSDGGTLIFVMDADVALGPLALSLQGLGVGSELTAFSPVFALSGLGVSYAGPPLQVLGTMLRVPDAQLAKGVEFQFDGELLVKAENFAIAALASYAQLATGLPSLFVFAQLEAPLGGPPAFFVTGLMGGFGFNRSLVVPGQDEVAGFPLLALATTPSQDPAQVIQVLEGGAPLNGVTKAWITPQAGEYWLAAGVQFTSYELVTTKALLVAEFGQDLTLALLGLSTLQLPLPTTGSQICAYVEMMIRVVVQPTQGYFAATAILSKNSYVLTPDCHLTGGFAFSLWFGDNPNAGQFVITLGGYHPAFQVPGYFPQVPRLGFNWPVSDTVSIKGDAYFALTGSCAMAGGGLQVLYHDGDLQAWFTAQADFLVSWHPFFYTAQIAVSIGVSYRLNLLVCHKTISVTLGADLSLWGPPTRGIVRVDLVVVSFSVRFGSDSTATADAALGWSDFTALLPAKTDVCGIAITDGLFKTQDDTQSSSGKLWIVRAKQLVFQTRSAAPASELAYAGTTVQQSGTAPDGIAIRPMNLTGVTSSHNLSLYQDGSSTPSNISGWSLEPLPQTVPASLWSAPPVPFSQVPAQPSADVLPGELCGFSVTAPTPVPGDSRGPVSVQQLMEEHLSPVGQTPLSGAVSPSPDYLPTPDPQTAGLLQQVDTGAAQKSRQDLFTVLTGAAMQDGSALFAGADGDLGLLAAGAGHLFSDSPMQQN